mmetsp:Transcript_4750/g.11563  ORF Transcript_4750/g.11563 Transcript_4750/m.11563 type:complete len:206 (+) Transcript_4750:217-834(+)
MAARRHQNETNPESEVAAAPSNQPGSRAGCTRGGLFPVPLPPPTSVLHCTCCGSGGCSNGCSCGCGCCCSSSNGDGCCNGGCCGCSPRPDRWWSSDRTDRSWWQISEKLGRLLGSSCQHRCIRCRSTIGMPTLPVRGSSFMGGRGRRACSVSQTSAADKKLHRVPSKTSHMQIPYEYTSDGNPYGRHWMTSGAMVRIVPISPVIL